MSKIGQSLLLALAAVSLTIQVTCAWAESDMPAPQQRAWKSASGQTVDATFEKYQFGKVYLKKTDGATVAIPLSKLSSDDQALAKELHAAATPAKPTLTRKLSTRVGAGTLTDEEIASLKTEYTDEKGKKRFQLSASFGPARCSTSEKKKFASSGKIPVRFTCALYEYDLKSAKPVRKRAKGNCKLYVKDDTGKIVFKKSVSLDKMCPS